MTILSHVYTWITLVAMKTSDDNDTDAPSERISWEWLSTKNPQSAKRHGDPERLIKKNKTLKQQFRFKICRFWRGLCNLFLKSARICYNKSHPRIAARSACAVPVDCLRQ